uniref:Uncharacterized protein n=1 Tax=Chromera velia CCMP2878 TaxID=1169474 RepID=A0A0G4G6R4_9ALVE|eukprot:Cvel_4210.t1-p1 / transcript=Cvel_4210.t1 / gene=Cvel_4210 / organism=Chromera_velia_CCMP2878 / gene_product=hypothetical protein / transcript_product=hypothetical protein / location=Cvel_scaffold182:563-6289(+) / protein_length=1141 / sequence_SO=supercontig / SO=protein_coding / is_pseudo=false
MHPQKKPSLTGDSKLSLAGTQGLESASENDFLHKKGIAALSALFCHAYLPPELASQKDSFGLVWVVLHFIKTKRSQLPFPTLDLSGFSLGPGKLSVLLSSLPTGVGPLETLVGGQRVCTSPLLPVVVRLLQRLRRRQGPPDPRLVISLKNLMLKGCMLLDRDASEILFQSLLGVLQKVDLSENCLRSGPMETFGSLLTCRDLSTLEVLDVSENPLGSLGVMALSRGLETSRAPLSLHTLKLRNTRAKKDGICALGKAFKAKRTTSLRLLDLGKNDMTAGGLKEFAAAVGESALPELRVLLLDRNRLTRDAHGHRDFIPFTEFMTAVEKASQLEELDLSDDRLGEQAATAFAAAVQASRFPSLRILKMLETDFGPNATAALGLALGTAESPELEVFEFSGFHRSWLAGLFGMEGLDADQPASAGTAALATAFGSGRLNKVRELKLVSRNEMSDQNVAPLCRSLVGSFRSGFLKSLHLETGKSPVGASIDEGVVALADGFREGKLCLLESLVLDFLLSRVGGEALFALGEALGSGGVSLNALKRMSLRWKETDGDRGLRGVAEGLGRSVGGFLCLETLSLKVACMGGEGCKALGEVLSSGKGPPSLRFLEVEMQCDGSLNSFCEGLSVGSLPPNLAVDFVLWKTMGVDSDHEGDGGLPLGLPPFLVIAIPQFAAPPAAAAVAVAAEGEGEDQEEGEGEGEGDAAVEGGGEAEEGHGQGAEGGQQPEGEGAEVQPENGEGEGAVEQPQEAEGVEGGGGGEGNVGQPENGEGEADGDEGGNVEVPGGGDGQENLIDEDEEGAEIAERNTALMSLATLIRSGKIPGLRKLKCCRKLSFFSAAACSLGKALSDSVSNLLSFCELVMDARQVFGGNREMQKAALSMFLRGLAEGNGSFSCLRTLDLGGAPSQSPPMCDVGAQCLENLMVSGKCPSLEKLSFNAEWTGQAGLDCLRRMLSSRSAASLRQLSFRCSSQEGIMESNPHAGMCRALETDALSRLEELRVSGTLGGAAVRSLSMGLALGKLVSLRKLNLEGTALKPTGGLSIAVVLVKDKLPALRHLNMRMCELGDDGVEFLTQTWRLREPPPLEDINLGFNGITGEGGNALGEFLKSGRLVFLKNLNLAVNRGVSASNFPSEYPLDFTISIP